MSTEKHITSKADLSQAMQCARSTVDKWLGDPAFPRKTARGWPRREVLAYSKQAKAKAKEHQTGDNADLKRVRLQRQIDLIDRQIRRADWEHERERGNHMPLDEHHAELDESAAIVLAGLELWVQWCAAEFRDARIYTKAKETRDRVRQNLSDRFKEAGG